MGRAKALLPFRNGSFLSVLAETLRQFCDPVIAVFGFDAPFLMRSAPRGIVCVENSEYRKGMLSSLQAGLRSVPEGCDAAIFALIDHPALASETISVLSGCDAPIVIPRCRGRRGHPVLIRRELFGGFLDAPLSGQVRDVISGFEDQVAYVDVNDPGIFDDIDDPQLYRSLLAREAGRS
jgi:molybdenum cofactor cytidylyltransferase